MKEEEEDDLFKDSVSQTISSTTVICPTFYLNLASFEDYAELVCF